MPMTTETVKTLVGITEFIDLAGHEKVPAKIDTGADSSAIWASKIRIEPDGTLCFSLFDESSPFYNGKILKRKDYSVVKVRSTIGKEEIRFRTRLSVKIAGKKICASFNLANRSKNTFPVLIGRKTLSGKFIVDPSLQKVKMVQVLKKTPLKEEFRKSPYAFYQKYFQKGEKL